MTWKRAACFGLCAGGVDTLYRHGNRAQLLIVGYHGVRLPQDPPHWLLLPLDQFRRQVDYLRRHYTVLPMDEALDALREGRLPERAAVITFDDGYLNNRTLAWPVLREAGLPCTIYLTTGLLGTDDLLWTTAVEMAARRTRIRVEDVTLAWPSDHPTPHHPASGNISSWCKDVLKSLPPQEREIVLDRLGLPVSDETAGRHPGFRMMTPADVQALAQDGVTFGGHTVRHPTLSTLDDVTLREEIERSIGDVRRLTRSLTSTFVYPNGTWSDFDDRCTPILKALDIRGALTTVEGHNSPETDPYQLRRIVVGDDSSLGEFRLRVSGAWRSMRALRPIREGRS